MRPILLAIVLLTACGSTSSTSSSATLTGNLGFQAVAVSGYQAFRGQADFPYLALQATLPSTSPFAAKLGRPRAALTSGGGLVPELGLYSTAAQTGNTATISFFSDAALTQPAGSVVLTGLQGAPGTFTSYPATISGSINITGGNLPCSGALTITMNNAAGNNSLKGNLTLPKTSVTMSFDFTLDDTGNVGGSSIITEHGSTISMTGISGGLAADAITGQVVVTPSGWTGTGSFSLLTGDFSVVVATGSGNSSASADGQGGLELTFADGTQETVTAALTSQPDAPVQASDAGVTGVDAGAFTQIVPVPGMSIQGKSADGRFVGQITSSGAAAYLAPGSAAPVALNSGGHGNVIVYGVNANGAMVGVVNDNQGAPNGDRPAYWASPTAAPVVLALPAGYTSGLAVGINDSGQIAGAASNEQAAFHNDPIYYPSPTATPSVLSSAGVTRDSFGKADGYALAINNHGEMVGDYVWTGPSPDFAITWNSYAWTTPAANPVALAVPAGDVSSQAFALNDSGAIVGSTAADLHDPPTHAVLWSSATAQPSVLTNFNGDNEGAATDINSSGVIVGCSSVGLEGSLVRPGVQFVPADGEINSWSGAAHVNLGVAGNCTGGGTYVTDTGVIAEGQKLYKPN
jgi:hypothetical protein